MAPETLDSPDTELKPLIATLLAQNGELLARIDTLLARIAELEARTGKPPKTPTNSSLPPSTVKEPKVAAPPGEKKRRKGRPGVARTLSPEPAATRDVYVLRRDAVADRS